MERGKDIFSRISADIIECEVSFLVISVLKFGESSSTAR